MNNGLAYIITYAIPRLATPAGLYAYSWLCYGEANRLGELHVGIHLCQRALFQILKTLLFPEEIPEGT
jgi:hypothetical protein